jgi:hypothetical protein
MPVGTPVQIRFTEDELHALDGYRRDQANPPSRAAAGRELIHRALIEHQGPLALRRKRHDGVGVAVVVAEQKQ